MSRVSILFQLFRKVAAALPGMDSTENKPPEDSILLTIWKNRFLRGLLLTGESWEGGGGETRNLKVENYCLKNDSTQFILNSRPAQIALDFFFQRFEKKEKKMILPRK